MDRYNPEEIISPEVEKKIETKIILEFMRHAKQEKEGKWDKKKRLNEEGKSQSVKKGKEVNPNAKVSLAIASSRERAQETAYRVMLANEGIDSKIKTMEDVESLISDELKVGKKMKIDARLDSVIDGPIGKFYNEADNQGRFLQWAVNESDSQAIEYGDGKTLTYKRAAGNIAEIIRRYLEIGRNFNGIVLKRGEQEVGNQLERYIATHQGVGELFLAKVLELKENAKKRDEYLKSLGEGFRHTEGFRIGIINKGSEQSIYMTYRNAEGKEEKIEIKKELLEEIIKDKDKLEKAVNG
jgi:broad specificity phosphatase PhoE